MTTDWTRRSFTGTFRKFREGYSGREALISEIVDTSGKVEIDWLWLPCPMELAYVCTHSGAEIAFEADCRHYPKGIELPNGKRAFYRLQRAGLPLHMKRRSAPTTAPNLAQIKAKSELDEWLHLG